MIRLSLRELEMLKKTQNVHPDSAAGKMMFTIESQAREIEELKNGLRQAAQDSAEMWFVITVISELSSEDNRSKEVALECLARFKTMSHQDRLDEQTFIRDLKAMVQK